MGLQYILGSSGSGKSRYLYDFVLKQSRENPKQVFFVIVPEQFTLQTQHQLVKLQENHGLLNIDVVSFQRLAYRVFDELGLKKIKVLEETGKNFVLRKVAESKKDQLRILRGNIRKNGYINEIKSVISELSQYQVTSGQLEELLQEQSLPYPFRLRLQDIQTLYQGFREYLQGNYITTEEILEVLGKEAKHSKLLENSVLLLDGFTGFTPVQYTLLEQLLPCVSEVYVTVTLEKGQSYQKEPQLQDLFFMSKKMVRNLEKIAEKCHVLRKEPVWLPLEEHPRFIKSKQLGWLEKNLFRFHPRSFLQKGEDLVFSHLTDPRQELFYVAGEIQRLIRQEGYRYKEIAIVCGDVELYGNYLPRIFDGFQIPYFVDKKNNISYHPMTEMIKFLLAMVDTDFSQENVMAYLRCGLSGFSMEEIDLLENYLMANKIRGWKKWQKKWVRNLGISDITQQERINEIREKIVEQMEKFYPVFRKKEGTVLEKTVALYEFLVQQKVQEQLEKRKVQLEAQGRLSLANEYAQIYKLTMDLLNKLALLLEQEVMDLSEYRKVLQAGFEASMVGIIPPGYDRVLFGDIERTRLPEIRVLFLVGANEGLIPKGENPGGLISQQEREIFRCHGMELAPSIKEKAFMQKFYLYLNVTKPSEKLYVTWVSVNGEGKEIRKSYFVSSLEKLFPHVKIANIHQVNGWEQIVTPQSSLRVLTEGLSKVQQGDVSSLTLALLNWYQKQENWKELLEKLLEAAFYTYENRCISREVTKKLYGNVLENSVTRLEKFASCAFSHFLSYGIGLKERYLGEFAAVDLGNLIHKALECYSIKMEKQGYHWLNIPKEKREELMEEAVLEMVEQEGGLLYQSASGTYLIQRILRILNKTVETVERQIAESKFTPEGYEVSFAFGKELEAVNFTLGPEEKMRLRGKIDRIDVKQQENELYVKVVDYKSGNTKFQLISLYHGLQLQLAVYLNAAVEILKEKYPGQEVIPTGMFYYHVDDPVLEVKKEITEKEIKDQIFQQLQMDGVGTDGTDDSVTKTSRQATKEDLKLYSQFVNTKIRNLGREIYQGDIQVNPYVLKEQSSCDYCPYHGICGFDKKLPGYQHRRLWQEKDLEKIKEKMREEVLQEDEIDTRTTESSGSAK